MRIRLLNLLLLALLVLALTRLWVFLREPPPALPAIAAQATAPEPPAEETSREVPVVRPEAYDVIVARDLFSPTRGVVPPAPAAAARPAAKPQPPPKVTLYGVVIIDGQKTAYLQEGTQESRPRKVRENENFAGGVVKTIRPDGVTFVFAGNEINLPLRKPQEGGGAPPPRNQDLGGAAPRSSAPARIPRRLTPTGVQQGQLPVPGRPARLPAAAPPEESEEEIFGDEEFLEEDFPLDEEDPDMMEIEEDE